MNVLHLGWSKRLSRSFCFSVLILFGCGLVWSQPASAVVLFSDGFGDADLDNNGVPLEGTDVDMTLIGNPDLRTPRFCGQYGHDFDHRRRRQRIPVCLGSVRVAGRPHAILPQGQHQDHGRRDGRVSRNGPGWCSGVEFWLCDGLGFQGARQFGHGLLRPIGQLGPRGGRSGQGRF